MASPPDDLPTVRDEPPGEGGGPPVPYEHPGDEIGPYTLVSLLGEGGFGSVWLARRRAPFEQKVALKVIKPGMDSRWVLSRFEQERQALALMEHPSIAKVYDGGLTPRGRPYFAMEYVKGEPITAFCDRLKLGIEDRLRLFAEACEAVQHAHLKGIVHRDLKPSNILAFRTEGGESRLKVIDFGVAKAMGPSLTGEALFTESFQMLGTPEYMSPEQADPGMGGIDTRSDVYSLGVLLYELLVGATPWDGRELRRRARREIQRILREEDPPSPSSRLSTLLTRDRDSASRLESTRRSRVEDLKRRLRGELEWIPLKAMRKEPQHRYQTALSLAEDIRNYLEGKPLLAGPESAGYRVRKYLRRHAALATGAAAVAAALLAGIAATSWSWRQEALAREVAQLRLVEAIEAKKDTQDLLAANTIGNALDAAFRVEPDTVQRELEVFRSLGRGSRVDAKLAEAIADQSISGLRVDAPEDISVVALSPDGKTVVTGHESGLVRLWDAATGGAIGDPLPGHAGRVFGLAWSPGGKVLASGAVDGTIRLWDVVTGQELHPPLDAKRAPGEFMDFSPDGQTLWSASTDTAVLERWDVRSGRAIGEPWDFIGQDVASSPDGKILAVVEGYGVQLVDAATGGAIGERIPASSDWLNACSFTPDGKGIAIGGSSGTILLCEVPTGRVIRTFKGHRSWVVSLAFSPDGKTLASGGEDRTIRLWDPESGQAVGDPLQGHRRSVAVLRFAADGDTLTSAGEDGEIRRWDVRMQRWLARQGVDACDVAFSPDGLLMACATSPPVTANPVSITVKVMHSLMGVPYRYLVTAERTEPVYRVAFSPDGTTVAGAGLHGSVLLWDLTSYTANGTAMARALPGHKGSALDVAFSPDGRMLASAGLDGTVRIWSPRGREPICRPLVGHQGPVRAVAFRASDGTLVSGGDDGTIRRWDLENPEAPGLPWQAHRGGVLGISLSPDGTTLASGGHDGFVRLWDAATGAAVGAPLAGHRRAVESVSFSPDGRTVASAGVDGTVRLWDVSTGRAIGGPILVEEQETVGNSVEFSPDGSMLAFARVNGFTRFWHAIPFRERAEAIRRVLADSESIKERLWAEIDRRDDSGKIFLLQRNLLADHRFVGMSPNAVSVAAWEISAEHHRRRESLSHEMWVDGDRIASLRRAARHPVETVCKTLETFQLYFLAKHALVNLPADAPERDLPRIRAYLQAAAEGTERRNPEILATLARANWELGDKAAAIEVQREAIARRKAIGVRAKPGESPEAARASFESILVADDSTLARYQSESPPSPSGGTGMTVPSP